ncbi:hypothetical protein CRG98_038646 [Punica granatum]|nr:hypothetical protein CRG98_038646 [Punica granatum]
MGHESESLDEFVEAHKTCLNDLMYFPTRNAYGLSSVAGNMEKLEALQNEFESVKKRIDEDREKSMRLEKKIKTLTHGYQMREKTLWDKIESTFKQMDTAGTELECFQALQKQEQLAASHRVSNLWEEVQKQKELERTLQSRYGSLLAGLEKTKQLIEGFRAEAQRQEETEAKNHAFEMAKAASEVNVDPLVDEEKESKAEVNVDSVADEEKGSMAVSGQEMDSAPTPNSGASAHNMNEEKTEDMNEEKTEDMNEEKTEDVKQPDEEMPPVEKEEVAAEQDNSNAPMETEAAESVGNHVVRE